MLRSSLCDFSRAYIKVKGTVNFANMPDAKVVRYCFKNCAPFEACRLSINNNVVDETDFLHVVMPMYNLLEYSDNFNKTSSSMYELDREKPGTGDSKINIWASPSAKDKFKKNGQMGPVTTVAGQTREKDVTLFVPFTYLSTFFRSLEMPLINCEIELQLTWSKTCLVGYTDENIDATLIANAAADTKLSFQITDTKTYFPVVTLRSIEGEKLLRQLESGFSKTINWNKLTIREQTIAQDNNFNVMIEPTFQGYRLFVLAYASGANDADRNSTSKLFIPTKLIDNCNITIDGRNMFESPIKAEDRRGYENLRDVMIGNGDDYIVGSLIDYDYFANTYKTILL